ncbi:MAG: class I SAM-dependent methyltransferase [Clostridium sp.]|jgi:23S rRNA (cytosine1962-C5)-methyltransferase|nr:class I SAM-dependent methyltransferase [Clostridium sp.]
MWVADRWKDYEILDSSKGEKLERWGAYTLVRPDPQVIWDTPRTHPGWERKNAHYHRSAGGGGEWEFFRLPEEWSIRYGELTFGLKPFRFKHTGLFPEQAVNWEWFSPLLKHAGRPVKVLNLFAYTGGATLSAAAVGAQVTHVDASKGMVNWAKENAAASGLKDAPIRFLVDDCLKFVEREIRRGNRYDAIIMDPPSYGRGPKGEVWKLEENLWAFLETAVRLLSDNPLFFLVNSYTTGLQPGVLKYLLELAVAGRFGGYVEAGEIGLPIAGSGLVLPCGACGRWQAQRRPSEREPRRK